MKLYLIRHGETDQNKNEIIQGRGDFKLSVSGISQAQEAGKTLKTNNYIFTKAYSSPLSRAYDTLSLILKEMDLDLNIIIKNNLIERDFGELEGLKLTKDVRMRFIAEDARGFEKRDVLFKRVQNILNNIASESDARDSIIIVTHSHIIKPLLMMLDEKTYDYNTKLDNLGMAELAYENGEFKLISLYGGLKDGQIHNQR
ncbi:histidine phosphatase family protein [bacterium]|nr:histidine phosphatase family protein [bacterium]